MPTLIANSGIQFIKKTAVINRNISKRLYFREWNTTPVGTQMELLYPFTDPISGTCSCISWNELYLTGEFLQSDKQKLKPQYRALGNVLNVHQFTTYNNTSYHVFLSSTLWNKYIDYFKDKWLPFPYFQDGLSPLNWCRAMISPSGDVDINGNQTWNLVLAFDTRTEVDDGVVNSSPSECPIITPGSDLVLTPCGNDLDLHHFVWPNKLLENTWIAEHITHLVYGFNNIAKVPTLQNGTRHEFTVAYIYLLSIIRDSFQLSDVTLYNDSIRNTIHATMVVDMGNSKTTAILVENNDITKCQMLSLQHISCPFEETHSPFDMNVTFSRADFGVKLGGSRQFIYPSVLRLGAEAGALFYKNEEGYGGTESLSVCSSPKRYLWDLHRSEYEWRFIHPETSDNDENDIIYIDGLTTQFDEKGKFIGSGGGGAAFYSRRSLMTFSFIEMLVQARRQLNSDEYRSEYAGIRGNKRIVTRIILTCPPAMSKMEQQELRKAAAEAQLALTRYYNGTADQPINNIEQIIGSISVTPSIGDNSWAYDEATCSQMVFLCSEIAEKYGNDCSRFFELYGKERDDLVNYNRKSLTVASLDIGAGTTDLMITAYKQSGNSTITPVPLFWESFTTAGDDILKLIIRDVILEGEHGHIAKRLKADNRPPNVVTAMLNNFFGVNHAGIPFSTRLLRRKFVRQVSIPIANMFLELTRQGCEYKELEWNDIFTNNELPDEILTTKFQEHFGFDITTIKWQFSSDVINNIIKVVFDGLLKKICGIISRYDCDIMICAGRPTSLKQIESMLMQNYPVPPNRLKMLNRYNVGMKFPFHDGNGYIENQKSIVAVGALFGYYASQGGYNGLHIDTSAMAMLPTTEYFGTLNENGNWEDTLMTPQKNDAEMLIAQLPAKLGCRLLDDDAYPARPFYSVELSKEKIIDSVRSYLGNPDPQKIQETLEKVEDTIQKSATAY